MPNKPCCQYQSPEGEHCSEIDMGSGFCFWHDKTFDKSGLDLKEKLERYAQAGGLLKGIQVRRANLEGLNLVRSDSKEGYNLSGADFYRCNLRHAHFFNVTLENGSVMKADLSDANLHCANFRNTNLLGIKLYGARVDNFDIGGHLIQEVTAYDFLAKGDETAARDHFEQSEEIYRNLRRAAERQGLFEDSGAYTYKELVMRRHKHPKWSGYRISSKCIDLMCGYGEHPYKVIGFSLFLIFVAAVLFFFLGVNSPEGLIRYDPSLGIADNFGHFADTLYYSVVTFTTLGYGDITPVGYSRLVAAVEAFTGSFTLAIFVVVFVKRMTR